MLGDEPVAGADDDLLGAAGTADSLVRLITGSRASSPFTVAIDAGWGMGKSSLMRLMRTQLEDQQVPTVWFNAWTSGSDALEVLIKSVLLRFDRNVVRRAYHRIAQHRRIVGFGRIALALGMSVLGLRRLVDRLWSQLSVDAKARDEIRSVVHDMARDWAGSGTPDGRQLVVFVDDLDRCPPEVVLAVCEAIKLYLDVPGLVFVIGCDQAALARNLRGGDGASAQAVEYLEKIVQVHYGVPVPNQQRARQLAEGYVRRSGTAKLFGPQLTSLLVQRTQRNPRRIKRLLNGFVLEHHLDDGWREFGASALLRVILLQQFYPDFYRVLTGPEERDPIPEFLSYAAIRADLRRGRKPDETVWTELFTSHDLQPPRLDGADDLEAAVGRLEEELPVSFPALAAKQEFSSLVRDLGDEHGLREHLQREPETRARSVPNVQVGVGGSVIQAGQISGDIHFHTSDLSGLRVLWASERAVREQEAYTDHGVDALGRRGARVEFASDLPSIRDVLRESTPDVIVSDITRSNAEYAGLDTVQALRSTGEYLGPVIFYTARITPARQRRASELAAEGITDDPERLIKWIEAIARPRHESDEKSTKD